VGTGHDTHRLGEGRPLVLGGVRVEHPRGLVGHSDADVVLHAVTDALLGAAGLGDIGDAYPDTDPKYRDCDSALFVTETLGRLTRDGWRVVNLDVTLFAQEPKLGPVKAAIRANLAKLLGLPEGAVNVKAKTGEHVGHIGRGEAIGCQATVLVERADAVPPPRILGGFKPGVWPWVLLLAAGVFHFLRAPQWADGHHRDFITHWTLARMAVTGHRAESYDFPAQAAMLREALPPSWTGFLETRHIANIGVSPYPPVMAILYAPLGLLPPGPAALAMYYFSVGLAVIGGVALARASGGRMVGPAAAAALIFFPVFPYVLTLGQNSALTIALLALGWNALAQRRDAEAGVFWGLLAYKPHWLVAVAWLPLVYRRPRVLGWMAVTVAGMCAIATLWLGPESWGKWVHQARALAANYHDPHFQEDFLFKAGDLRAVAIRYLPDRVSELVGWGTLAAVWAVTIVCYLIGRSRRGEQRPEPPADRGAPALLFACVLIVPYLFYYDEMVFLVPLLVLWCHWSGMSRAQLVTLIALTVVFYLVPLGQLELPDVFWPGPPIGTFAALALWGLSLWVAVTRPRPAPAWRPVLTA
jgi:2-C-methyl-D-erythritol 2,4-cyclodiphosphate synthase